MLDLFTIEAVDQIDEKKLPLAKGVYCFLITEEGIEKINQIRPSIGIFLHDLTEITFMNTKIYLVYIGQAGARNIGGSLNLGHIRQRFQWHVLQRHTVAVIKNKALSSFRATLGCLLMNNLLLSESQINSFLNDHLYFGYKIVDSVDNASVLLLESSLIEKYRPILNSKGNPCAKKGVDQPAFRIATLRREVYKAAIQSLSL